MAERFVLVETQNVKEYAIEVYSPERQRTLYLSETGKLYDCVYDCGGIFVPGKVTTLEEENRERLHYIQSIIANNPSANFAFNGKDIKCTIIRVSNTSDCPEYLLTHLKEDYLRQISYSTKLIDKIKSTLKDLDSIKQTLVDYEKTASENYMGDAHYIKHILENESPILKTSDFLSEFVNCLPKDFYQIVFPRVPEQLNDNECNTPIYEIDDGKIKIQRAVYLYEYPENSSLQKVLDECRTKCSFAAINHPGFKDEIFRDTVPIEETIEVIDESLDCDYTYTPSNPYGEPPTHMETVTVGEQCIGILYRQRIEIPYEGRLTKEYAKELADKFTNEILALTPSLENNSGDEIED